MPGRRPPVTAGRKVRWKTPPGGGDGASRHGPTKSGALGAVLFVLSLHGPGPVALDVRSEFPSLHECMEHLHLVLRGMVLHAEQHPDYRVGVIRCQPMPHAGYDGVSSSR